MLKQQELSYSSLPDTLFEMHQHDRDNEDDVPICEHLRPFKTIKYPGEFGIRWSFYSLSNAAIDIVSS